MSVILYEWIDRRGLRGALSTHPFEQAQLAKLDETLDRIEELEHLDHESMKGRIHPFHKRFKKLKVRGDVALRPILVRGPVDQEHEVTFLLVAREQNRKLDPPKKEAVRIASDRLDDILDDPRRRRRHDRD